MPGLTPHQHPTRREILRCGVLGTMGVSLSQLLAWNAQVPAANRKPWRSVIYIYLTGGLSQHESFDPKPEAGDMVRGDFQPIATRTPGVQICEHLPMLATRSQHWSLVRSLTHPHNEHADGHHVMLTGRSQLPPGFSRNGPRPTDFPSIASVAGSLVESRNHLPPAVMMPRTLMAANGDVRPGQFAGMMGEGHNPWLLKAAAGCDGHGSCPDCFHYTKKNFQHTLTPFFQAPNLKLPEGLSLTRLAGRQELLSSVEAARADLDRAAATADLDRYRQGAMSLLTSGRVRDAFDLELVPSLWRERYGKHLFGYSLLLARRLVETGVRIVQVNLGKGSTWDTHGDMFPRLKEKLLPPLDQALSALVDDLHQSGQLEETLLVMAGDFGRTPKISQLRVYDKPGRDHWGAVQSVWLAGGGIEGGRVIGASDRDGGRPSRDPQKPENLAATMFDALGIPREAHWNDVSGRPIPVYQDTPIPGLS